MATEHAVSFFRMLYLSVLRFYEDNGPRMAAALAYYTVFSIPGMLFIAIAMAGAVYGTDLAEKELIKQLTGTVGHEQAITIQKMVSNANKPGATTIATLIGIATLLFGGSGVFLELQADLNIVWRVPTAKNATVFGFLWQRFTSFLMVFGIGLLLLISLFISTALAVVSSFVQQHFPSVPYVIRFSELGISYISVLALFACIYKIIPDRKVLWSDVWLGASLASILFTLSKYGIGLYLANSSVSSTYGAAGSLIIILIWVYFSSQILLLGAEMTYVFAKEKGSLVRNTVPARRLDAAGSVSSEREASADADVEGLEDPSRKTAPKPDPSLSPGSISAKPEDKSRSGGTGNSPSQQLSIPAARSGPFETPRDRSGTIT